MAVALSDGLYHQSLVVGLRYDAGYPMADARNSIPDAGCLMVELGYQMLVPG
ncbi:MAG: hypothetical protein JW883_14960 [Deltaproteobacteria bacterium]|nr:hypothetical protein [Deltaproteobacteria bacterium]